MNLMMICLEAIERIISTSASSKEVIDDYLKKFELTPDENALFKHIISGVINNLLYLEFLVVPFLDKKRYRSWFRPLVYLAIYKLIYLEEDQELVIEETLELARIKDRSLTPQLKSLFDKFISSHLRDENELDSINYLSVKYSYPAWLVSFLMKDYSYSEVERILQLEYNHTVKTISCDDILQNIEIYDNQKILDLYASTTPLLLELAKINQTLILDGVDPIFENITNLTNQATKLSTNIHYHHLNPLDVSDIFTVNNYDYVIAFVPSSGLGQMYKYIDYKYFINLSSISQITTYQQKVLTKSISLVKDGGYYIYVTNTLNTDENEKQMSTLLKNNIQFRKVNEKKVLPSQDKAGYYLCILQKNA